MGDRTGTAAGPLRNRRPAFRGGIRPAIALLSFFVLWTLLTNVFVSLFLEPNPDPTSMHAVSILSKIVQIGVTVLVLRYEGVRLREIGLSTHLLVPAVVAIGGLIVALNAVGATLVVLGGRELSVGVFAHLRTPPESYPLFTVVTGIVNYHLFVGLSEELAFRGYFQNKLTALFGAENDRLRMGFGIVAAAFLFSILHVPLLLHEGVLSLRTTVGVVAINLVPGILFGVVYASTRNLYLVALLHGIADWLPVFVVPGSGAWPVREVLVLLVVPLILLYRRWTGRRSARSPIGHRPGDPW